MDSYGLIWTHLFDFFCATQQKVKANRIKPLFVLKFRQILRWLHRSLQRGRARGTTEHERAVKTWWTYCNRLVHSPMLFYYSGYSDWWLSNQNLTCEFLSSMPQVRKLFAPRGVSCCMLPESGHGLLMEDLNVWSRLCIILHHSKLDVQLCRKIRQPLHSKSCDTCEDAVQVSHYAAAWFCVSNWIGFSELLLQDVNKCEQQEHGSCVSTACYERFFVHLEFKPTPCAKDLKDPTWKSCQYHWRRLGTFFVFQYSSGF